MKLKNKKTGEIVSLEGELTFGDKVRLLKHYNSLAELCDEWEDYKEPKDYWFIRDGGNIDCHSYRNSEITERRKEIGNYFESKEEAELAVNKLKAWKRLKDAGFKFNKWEESTHEDSNIAYFTMPEGDVREDLDLLFSEEKDETYTDR